MGQGGGLAGNVGNSGGGAQATPQPVIPRRGDGDPPLVVLSGPSGVGKGTLCRMLAETDPSLALSVSMTSRPPRVGEQEGVDYFFVSPEGFEEAITQGGLLEWARYNANYYGTPRHQLDKLDPRTECLLLEIDVQGALQVKRNFPGAFLIFLAPPGIEELERRLRLRGQNEEADLQERLRIARAELAQQGAFDAILVNERLTEAFGTLRQWLQAYRNP